MQYSRHERWSVPVQLLHWLSLVLIIAIAAMGLIMVDLPRGDATRSLLYATHKSLGVTLLFLVLVRLVARLLTRAPPALPAPVWQQRIASAMHLLIYVLLLAIPLSGWLLNSVAGQPLPWFGLINLPALAAKNADWRSTLDTAHVALFWTLAATVAMHVMAVLHHQLISRDGTLSRMMPRRASKR